MSKAKKNSNKKVKKSTKKKAKPRTTCHSKKKGTSRISRHTAYLSLLGNTKQKKRRSLLIDFAGKDDLDAVCQCIFNVLAGNIKISTSTFNKLKKHKKTLRYLINRRVNNQQRKKVLKQKGGFLPFLLPLAVKLLGGLVPAIAGAVVGRR